MTLAAPLTETTLRVRKSDARGGADYGWLKTQHTFSFGDYFDPEHMSFGSLRVINEDYVAPGNGFPMHPHRNMEIVTYVLDGALEHKDTLGTGSVIEAGDVQRMSAGRGVRHSEFNPSPDAPVHLLQIWMLPRENGIEPSYEQKRFPAEEKRGRLRLIGSEDGRDGSVVIHQDVDLYATMLAKGQKVHLAARPGRAVWVQIARGKVAVNGTALDAGDGAGIMPAADLTLEGLFDAEALVFDMAA